jgi:hypothetical protein
LFKELGDSQENKSVTVKMTLSIRCLQVAHMTFKMINIAQLFIHKALYMANWSAWFKDLVKNSLTFLTLAFKIP